MNSFTDFLCSRDCFFNLTVFRHGQYCFKRNVMKKNNFFFFCKLQCFNFYYWINKETLPTVEVYINREEKRGSPFMCTTTTILQSYTSNVYTSCALTIKTRTMCVQLLSTKETKFHKNHLGKYLDEK